MTALERGYRRLLALYPAAYRAEYEEEMVGVLLASSTPERRRPDLREVADLVWAAVRVRLGHTRGTTRDTLWARALATLGAIGALLLLGKSLRPIANSPGWMLSVNYPFGERPDGILSEVDWFRAAVWALVVVAVLLRWRLAAAALTWVAVLGEVALLLWTPRLIGTGTRPPKPPSARSGRPCWPASSRSR